MKIYVCESGCVYEGGSAFYATTNYVDAWKTVRSKRVQYFTRWSNNHQGKKYVKKDRDTAFENLKAIGNNCWQSNYNYVRIRIF